MTPNEWNVGDPLSAMREVLAAIRETTWATSIEMNDCTLTTLRQRTTSQQRDEIIPGISPLLGEIGSFGVPITIDSDLPDGKARIRWSNGDEQVIP